MDWSAEPPGCSDITYVMCQASPPPPPNAPQRCSASLSSNFGHQYAADNVELLEHSGSLGGGPAPGAIGQQQVTLTYP